MYIFEHIIQQLQTSIERDLDVTAFGFLEASLSLFRTSVRVITIISLTIEVLVVCKHLSYDQHLRD
jgi:hypothetical protein